MTEEEKINGESNYSASNIQVLEGLEAVRKRPAMYIGDISSKGLHHLVYEVVDNSIDEALAGYCDHIEVTINEDNSITVQDNGRGIPVDFHEKEQKSALEVVMTVLHAGGKFDKGSYKVSGGLHGVGVSCVNALSTHMTTQVFRNGKIYQQEYECGHPLYSVKEVGTTAITGTRQQFWPDATIFTETVYSYDILATRMRELAYLNAGIKITLTDLRVKEEDGSCKQEVFYSVEGLKEFVRYIDSSREHLVNDVIYINTEKQGTPVEVAIMYNTSYNENIHSYVNNINTIEGGTHLAGFRRALTRTLKKYAEDWADVPMLAKTHGQPASPTRLGKEVMVFVYRLEQQVKLLKATPVSAKFGGATGNFNAHHVAFPEYDWKAFGNKFVNEVLGLSREEWTTQISNYDNMAAIFDGMKRIDTILIDLCRDFWQYVSMEYFKQKIKAGEVGSSAMPHKVNPIDFENAEGNLGMANAILTHLATKLPISRLQRDLTDSTVLRNVGVPMAHVEIAFKSLTKGLGKLLLNEKALFRDLDNCWAVVAEGIQTILRREGYPKPYEALKALTRTNEGITAESISNFIDTLQVSDAVKAELKAITPHNYTGI